MSNKSKDGETTTENENDENKGTGFWDFVDGVGSGISEKWGAISDTISWGQWGFDWFKAKTEPEVITKAHIGNMNEIMPVYFANGGDMQKTIEHFEENPSEINMEEFEDDIDGYVRGTVVDYQGIWKIDKPEGNDSWVKDESPYIFTEEDAEYLHQNALYWNDGTKNIIENVLDSMDDLTEDAILNQYGM